jgi:hypothetical protein
MPSSAAKRGTKPPADSPGHAAAASSYPAESAAPPVRPLKPRPKLLAVTSIVFALWVAFLVGLYFKTVYPRRSTAPRPDAKGMISPDAPAHAPPSR